MVFIFDIHCITTNYYAMVMRSLQKVINFAGK